MQLDLAASIRAALTERYEVGEEVGRGGMAIVCRARDLRHDRQVAIKVLYPDLARAVGGERFLREIQILTTLSHRNILPLLDSGAVELLPGLLVPWYVMPLVQGENLRARLVREGPLPLPAVLRLAREICAGLSHAHAQGYVHRDIKPENILLQTDQAVVADFGIARAVTVAGGSALSSTGIVVGTPAYMSPEQSVGSGRLDGRSDVYSLGIVLYEMLAGHPPFSGATPQAISARHQFEELPPIAIVRPSVPEFLERVLQRATAKVPGDRYDSADDLDRDLATAETCDTKDSRGTTPARARVARRSSSMFNPWSRAGWRRGSVGLGLLLVLVLGAYALGAFGRRDALSAKLLPTIAVLYFENRSTDSTLGAFADGLTEELIHELSGAGNAFRVISPYGVRPYRGGTAPFDSMVKALKATVVVAGEVRMEGGRILVRAHLIDGATDTYLDSLLVERPARELVTVPRDAAAAMSAALRRQLGREVWLRTPGSTTSSRRALELFLAARRSRADAAALLERTQPEAVTSAVNALMRADSLLQQATKADLTWLDPRIERGWAMADRASLAKGAEQIQLLTEAKAIADEASHRAPTSPAALELRGTIGFRQISAAQTDEPGSRRIREAEADLRSALHADSTSASAWATLSFLLWLRGELEESAIDARAALAADPYYHDTDAVLLQLFYVDMFLGRFHQAEEWCRRGRSANPDGWLFVQCELTLLRHDSQSRPDPAQAWRLVAKLDSLDPAVKADSAGREYNAIYRRLVAATISARAGDRQRGLTELSTMERLATGDSLLVLDLAPDEAYLCLVLGQRARAEQLMTELLRARPVLRPLLARDPLLRSLVLE